MDFNVIQTEDGRIQINFERSNEQTRLVDAIVVGPAQYEKWSEDHIRSIIDQRWLAYLEAVKPRYDGFLTDASGIPVLDRNGSMISIWKLDDAGMVIVDEAGMPVIIEYQRDEAGDLVFGTDGKPVAVEHSV